MFSSVTFSNWRIEDAIGGVQSLIDKGTFSQANVSVPNEETPSPDDSNASGFSSSPNAKPLFNSLAGFALEVGDRLTINGEEVTFKGWVDQSQTAIEVKTIADDLSSVKQVRAKEIKSLSRSQDVEEISASQDVASKSHNDEDNAKSSSSEFGDQSNEPISDETVNDNNPKSPDSADHVEVSAEPEEIIEPPKEPEYNAWEVWTYLERQRLKTLKLINTFQAEWEANRFVREAERSAPSNLRVHYEIRPVWLDESEIMGDYQNTPSSHKSNKSKDSQVEQEDEDYADAIDVEVII